MLSIDLQRPFRCGRCCSQSAPLKRPGHSLRLVTSLFEGNVPQEVEWPTVLEIANRGWLVPALYVSLKRNGLLAEIPDKVRHYLAFLHDRNHERNRRLRSQLLEAIIALNARSIQPTPLKGAVNLFTADAENLGARMLSDLDISIAPCEVDETKAVLTSLGYQNLGNGREFGREQDVGAIELHDRPNPRSMKYMSQDLRASSPTMEQDGALAQFPARAHEPSTSSFMT